MGQGNSHEKAPDGVIPYSVDEHYEDALKWWGMYYGGDPLPKECLPDSGAVVLHKGKPAGMAFFYKTNAKMVFLHLAMANPDLGAGRRIRILRAAVAAAIDMARQHLGGEGFIWCCTDNAVVARIYAENDMMCPGEADVYFMPVGKQDHNFLM